MLGKRPGTGSMTRLSESRTTAASPVDAMKLDEVERTRVFLKVAIVTCVGSREAALAAPRVGTTSFVPVDAAIIGIVDDVQWASERAR